MATTPDYNVCCLQSVISHYQEMSSNNLLVIMLILTGVPPVISTYIDRLMLPGMCFPDVWSCIRYVIFTSKQTQRVYTDWCHRICMYKKMHTALCAKVHDRCYTCKCR